MPISAGTKIGQYEIRGVLGFGGMGEVYRARDTRLGREVALKVLPQAVATDPERIARFEREAQVLASLNHPHIASIYGFEDSAGIHALVMELVEGQTLAERISKGKLRLDEALPIARQIAEALEYAHECGVVHRDLKPANVKLGQDGGVKILDFGLAKALESDSAAADISSSPTISRMATQAGIILGTAAYMSPEQAKGKSVDRRTDIWAFGCLLYEMLAGRKPFDGGSVADVLAVVLRDEPNWSLLPPETPPGIHRLLRRCLNKDRKQRLQAIGEARIAIDEAAGASGELSPSLDVSSARAQFHSEQTAPEAPTRRALPWIAVLVFALLAAIFAVGYFSRVPPRAHLHFSAVTSFSGVQEQPALSPDGRSVAFVSNRDGHYNIYVGLIRGGNLVQITHDANLKSRPMWSPDGTALAYARLNDSGIWDIWQVAALGGTPRKVVVNANDPAWSADGHSLAYANTADHSIWVVDLASQKARQVAAAEPTYGRRNSEPRFSPDGRLIAFVSRSNGPYGELVVADLGSGKTLHLTNDRALVLSPAWSQDSREIYFASSRGGTMNIWRISPTGGSPEQVTAGEGDDAQLDVSSDGTKIVFSTWSLQNSIEQLDLLPEGSHGPAKALTNDPGRNQVAPAYSPDGTRLAYFSNLKGAENESIWVAGADGSNPAQLVRDERINVFPNWTPDSQHLIYAAETRSSIPDEYRIVLASGGTPEVVLRGASDSFFDVGEDGRLLFRDLQGTVTFFDPRNGKGEPLGPLVDASKMAPVRWSPDGHSVAYVVSATRENDPAAGLWVSDFKAPPRQIYRGWAGLWLVRGPANAIYFIEGHPDLNGFICKIAWDGTSFARTPATIPMLNSYWVDPAQNAQDHFTISPDGRHVAFQAQTVLQANIGLIEISQ